MFREIRDIRHTREVLIRRSFSTDRSIREDGTEGQRERIDFKKNSNRRTTIYDIVNPEIECIVVTYNN